MRPRRHLSTLAGDLVALLLMAATLSLACQGDCNRSDGGDADDGMEPAGDTCKPSDQSCHASPPAVTTEPLVLEAEPRKTSTE